jgi:hypothetical protein
VKVVAAENAYGDLASQIGGPNVVVTSIRLTGQPSSRTGENPPYGMRGGIKETRASFEARSAPLEPG